MLKVGKKTIWSPDDLLFIKKSYDEDYFVSKIFTLSLFSVLLISVILMTLFFLKILHMHDVVFFSIFALSILFSLSFSGYLLRKKVASLLVFSQPEDYEIKYKVLKHSFFYHNDELGYSLTKVVLEGIDNPVFVPTKIFNRALNKGYVLLSGQIRKNKWETILTIHKWIPVYKKPPPPFSKKPGSSQAFLLSKIKGWFAFIFRIQEVNFFPKFHFQYLNKDISNRLLIRRMS